MLRATMSTSHVIPQAGSPKRSPKKTLEPPSPERAPSPQQSPSKKHLHKAKNMGVWDRWQNRLGTMSLILSLFMQFSYVAFPAYNFALAIWATVHPFLHHRHNARTTILFISVLIFSCFTDIFWASLWISGSVFYDMLCQSAKIGILHCDGQQSYPGCNTNRFAAVMFILNIPTKVLMATSIWKVNGTPVITIHFCMNMMSF
jgi:hypothetical protein